jgi:membrane protease YdiL (CAAX protease family)
MIGVIDLIFMNHILVCIMIIVLPLASIFEMKKLKKADSAFGKQTAYLKIFVWYWLITIGFITLSSFRNVLYFQEPVKLNVLVKIAFSISFAYLIIIHFLPVILLSFSKKFRSLTAESFTNKAYIYPTTERQKQLFWIVPITVGICEEIIFRGYLYQYFQNSPFTLSAIVSFLLVCVIFGVGHFQQGVSGVVMSMILGFFLGCLYFVTGNLFLSIILHILFDAKILYISWRIKEQPAVIAGRL